MTTDCAHEHSHGHSHGHSNDHVADHSNDHSTDGAVTAKTDGAVTDEKARREEVIRKLKTACVLCLSFFIVEVIGGLLSGSLAVLSDAAHLFADLTAFAVAIIGSHIASMPATESHTFGLKRTESLAALFSMVSLVILSVGLAIEAIYRLWLILDDEHGELEMVDGKLMSWIAFIGVLVNVVLAYVLGEDHVHMVGADHGHDHSHGHEHGHGDDNHGNGHSHGHEDEHKNDEEQIPLHQDSSQTYSSCHAASTSTKPERNVNLHAAYLHVLADLAQSAVVFVAGIIIWWKPAWQAVDPVCTLVFCVLVSYSTVGIIRSSLSVLLEEVPPGMDWEEVHDAISAVDGVSEVHDLHIWSISHDNYILSVHANALDVKRAFGEIKELCNQRNINHLTIQLQPDSLKDCVTCADDCTKQCR